MKLNLILFFLSFVFFTSAVHAHTFTGMVGFYDGLSHPVLGIDHFLALVSVGIVSAQIGGRAIAKPNNITEKTIPYSTTIKADSSKLK